MPIISEILSNRTIQAAAISWASAQVIKALLTLILTRKFSMERMVGSGGMPSSHSAMSCAMVMSIGFEEGFESPVFALAFCFAMVVMYDAAGVRRSTGRNAAAFNQLVRDLGEKGFVLDEVRLKELVGHTPVQVMAGALLGILIGTLLS